MPRSPTASSSSSSALSGCGKSTLLRMVAGLEEITGGEIAIGGRVVNKLEPADRDIAMVFQNYALYPHMSVYDNMAYGLKIAKVPKAEIECACRRRPRSWNWARC
jgi:sn-glycerol 3-phosphate transport system ATP-binding protein